jgi:hypothetical protein
MKKALTLALGLGVTATAYVIATTKSSAPPQQSSSQPAEIVRSDTIASPLEQPISTTQKPNESIAEPKLSSEERAAEIKRTLVAVMGTWREASGNGLVERGLAPEDSERLAQQFVEGVADCLLEAVRKEYEARGKPDGDEMSWTQTMAYINLNRVQSAAVPCVANISQQAGIPLPADFGAAGSRTDDIAPEPLSPRWAADMEARIRDHVASYSAPAIKTVLVKCIEEGCNVTLIGRDIRIFDLEFDVFAEQNGFQHAVLRGDSNMRFVWLQR